MFRWSGRREEPKGLHLHGGVHRSSSVQIHRMLVTPAPLLGPDRTGGTVRPRYRRSPRRAASVLVPRPRGAPRRAVAHRRRDVVAAGATVVGVPQQEGGSGPTSVGGPAGHRWT